MDQMKRLVAVWQLLATIAQHRQYVEEQDIALLKRRVEGEGITFLTVVLPRLFKSLDQSFKTGMLKMPLGFTTERGRSTPRFLRLAWQAIFDEDGKLLLDADMGAVACIRQLSAVFYKLKLPYTDAQEADALRSFKRAERDLRSLDLSSEPSTVRLLTRARQIVGRLLAGVNPLDIRPRHGSGASACRVLPWERYNSFRYIPRLHEVFPYDEYFHLGSSHLVDELDALLGAERAEPMARVVFVPKDSRGPRLISCEPREFMFIQQGLWAKLRDTVRRYPAIEQQVGFTDQTVNRRLAVEGAREGTFATLDLKEASDRVSLELVRRLFPDNWVRALEACRSRATVLPSGEIVPLTKFAPMGSACCFPIEAICFWSIALAAITLKQGTFHKYLKGLFMDELTERDLRIAVFGDDIIVPTQFAELVIEALESCGLKVNKDKSYWNGPFRESCGMDSYKGFDVTPVRVKALLEDNTLSALRLADVFNNIISRYGYENVGLRCQLLFEELYFPVPVSNRFRFDAETGELVKTCEGLCLYAPYTDVPDHYRRRFSQNDDLDKPSYHRIEYRVPIERPIDVKVDVDRWGQVLRANLLEAREQDADRHALAKRTRIKYGWTAL